MKIRKISLLFFILSLFTIYIVGCSNKTSGESSANSDVSPTASSVSDYATYTDLAGRTVEITTDVKKIILLRSRDIYELSSILGEDTPDYLIGWGPDLKNKDNDGYNKFIEAFPTLKEIADTGDVQSDAVNIEKIIELDPDLIVADQYMLSSFQSIKKLIEAGLPVVCIDESSDPLATPQNGIRLLGKILGRESRANEIADYADEQVNIIYDKIAAIDKPEPSVYLECGDTGPTTFSVTYAGSDDQSWGTVLSRLKVKNIADGIVKGMAQIDPEQVLAQNPDIIVITGQNWTSASDSMHLGFYATEADSVKLLQAYTTRQGWSELSAVKNIRVYSIFQNLSMHIFDFYGLQVLAKDFYPDDFAYVNPDENMKLFFQKFMPISFSGLFAVDLSK